LLRGHVREVVAVFALLLVQALCELSLPRYMSAIVNVGVVGSKAGDAGYLGHMALVMFGFCVGRSWRPRSRGSSRRASRPRCRGT
jgi:ATP-binding cassette subfamily B protein